MQVAPAAALPCAVVELPLPSDGAVVDAVVAAPEPDELPPPPQAASSSALPMASAGTSDFNVLHSILL